MVLFHQRIDLSLLFYTTYDSYLNANISTKDRRYLKNRAMCEQKALLNYEFGREVLTREQFEENTKIALEHLMSVKRVTEISTISDPVLAQFAARELPNYQKIISTIVFLSYRNKKGGEVSGFIDFEESLHKYNYKMDGAVDWNKIYAMEIKLQPTPNDLSYFNTHSGVVVQNDSLNYAVQLDVKGGLGFLHRGDHKIIHVDRAIIGVDRNCFRSIYYSDFYGHVMFFDHILRKKI